MLWLGVCCDDDVGTGRKPGNNHPEHDVNTCIVLRLYVACRRELEI